MWGGGRAGRIAWSTGGRAGPSSVVDDYSSPADIAGFSLVNIKIYTLVFNLILLTLLKSIKSIQSDIC